MPFTVKGHIYVHCKEFLTVSTAGADRFQPFIEHEVGSKGPQSLEVHQIWSYQNLTVPWPGGLLLDFSQLPEGQPGRTKDLATNQTLSMWYIDNLDDDTQLTVQLLLSGSLQPLPGVGLSIGPSNLQVQYDDKGESLLNQFLGGMQFDVIVGDKDAHLEVLLGTVSTQPSA